MGSNPPPNAPYLALNRFLEEFFKSLKRTKPGMNLNADAATGIQNQITESNSGTERIRNTKIRNRKKILELSSQYPAERSVRSKAASPLYANVPRKSESFKLRSTTKIKRTPTPPLSSGIGLVQ